MKNPTKFEVFLALMLMVAWFCAMLVYNHYDLEKAGSLSVGAVVGVIFALFGYSADKGWKNSGMIIGVSFIATIVYNAVAGLIHYLN